MWIDTQAENTTPGSSCRSTACCNALRVAALGMAALGMAALGMAALGMAARFAACNDAGNPEPAQGNAPRPVRLSMLQH